jgi:Na+/melibiose symporter-like transporter
MPGLGLAFAFWLIFRFPLDELRMTEIRRELEARRGTAA